jgi:RNA ligase
MIIDYSEIQKRIDAGLITSRKHPILPFEILNYTQKTQFEKIWDPYTMMCRGLILDQSHNVVAKPFSKFFNLGETPETMIQNLPYEIPQITEKSDGSLGILYFENDLPSIATRGAFESPQAQWATNFIRNKKDQFGQNYKMWDFNTNYTYLFEIICPESKNVVNYDFEGLILLAVISNIESSELNIREEAEILNFPYAKTYNFKSLNEIEDYLKTISGNELEGFVCKYSNGLRVKIKSDDYKRLHKILSGFSEINIWDALSQGKSLDSFLNTVPDEFFKWIKETEAKFISSKNKLIREAIEISIEALKLSSRKLQANYIISHTKASPRGFSGLVFNLLDGNHIQAEKSAWNILKP